MFLGVAAAKPSCQHDAPLSERADLPTIILRTASLVVIVDTRCSEFRTAETIGRVHDAGILFVAFPEPWPAACSAVSRG